VLSPEQMQRIASDVKGRVHTLIKGEVALAMDTGANYRDVIFLMFSVLTACAADYAASTITDMRNEQGLPAEEISKRMLPMRKALEEAVYRVVHEELDKEEKQWLRQRLTDIDQGS